MMMMMTTTMMMMIMMMMMKMKMMMIRDNRHCPPLCASVSKVFSVTEAVARVAASGHKYKGTCPRNTNTNTKENTDKI